MDLSWYNTLKKPFFTPPSSLFAPAWTILYILMTVSFFLILRSKKNKEAVRFFLFQLFFNFIWSPIFFVLHNIAASFVVIIILWYLVFKTIQISAKIDKTASILLYPYLAWVTFATLLNLSVLILN